MAEEHLLRAAKLKLRRSIKISLYKARVVRCVHWQLPGGESRLRFFPVCSGRLFFVATFGC